VNGDFSKVEISRLLSDPWFIPDTTILFDQLQAFRERKEHFAIVVDEYGAFKGIVTLEDILEEIVGDIEDEHDVSVPGVRAQPNGSFIIDGTVTVRDLNRALGWNLPSENYSTLAGLVLHESKMIPAVGQNFTFYGYRFRILKRQRNQITLIRVAQETAAAAAA
jgi:Mg2+/Co2+ transporter CorB